MGLILVIVGVGLILIRERFVRANAAGSRELFGKADPYSRWPKATKIYSTTIVLIVGSAFIIFGLLTLTGVT